jgi:oxygen-dependent protoporphyrinogen oxidase
LGGGITGLTAAFRLAQKGLPVTLYEATDRVGGVLRSVRQEGYLAEFGPNTILETSPKISALIQDAGLASRRWYSEPNANNRYIVRGGRPLPVPSSPGDFFRSPLFSIKARLRLLAEPIYWRAPANREESLADFVVRRIGREFLDYAINPLVAGIYAGDPARLSVKHAFPKIHALEQRYGSLILGQILGAKERKKRGEVSKQEAKKVSFDEGLQVLTDTLHARLGDAVHLNSPVTAVRETAEGWRVSVGPNAPPALHAALLYAAPTYHLAELPLTTLRKRSWSPLAKMHYPPVASVVLGFRREHVAHRLDGFGMLIPAVEGFSILGTLFSSSLFPNRAPAGHVTLTSYLGGVRAPHLAALSPAELIERTVNDLRTILGVSGAPTFEHTCFYAKAIPQYEVGFGSFKELMHQLELEAPGLFFAGHYRDGIALSDSISSGHDVADRIERFLKARADSAYLASRELQAQPAP